MAIQNRDILLQGLVLGGFVVPLGGDGVSARIAFGAEREVARGVSTKVSQRIRKPEDILTISCYPEDPSHTVLVAIKRQQDATEAAGVRAPLAGNGTNLNNSEKATWADAVLTQAGDFILGQNTEVVTWTFELDGAERVKA